ncbi:MAG: c-type cytochrome biogenesis protein CcsB [Deltaproteobacteria bacterium]|nr:c-type cytochrome biogenesis protein CcsB [Deltaproteobacteria bacterium]
MHLILFKVAAIFYLISSIIYLTFLLRSKGSRCLSGFAFVTAGLVAHTISIIHLFIAQGYFPMATGFDALSLFAWLIVAIHTILQLRDLNPVLGAMAAPIATVLMFAASTLSYQITQPIVPVLKSWWLPIHVSFALAGNAVFTIMAMAGAMYIFQERLIKKKKIGRFHRILPSLETLDTLNRRALPIGFFLLTLGIISGALWASSAWGSYWDWDPKETWSLITWFAYAAMVHQRLALGWRGKKAAVLALAGFALVMFTFIGVSFLFPGHHSFVSSAYWVVLT